MIEDKMPVAYPQYAQVTSSVRPEWTVVDTSARAERPPCNGVTTFKAVPYAALPFSANRLRRNPAPVRPTRITQRTGRR
jgi:hypothetical protein